MTSNASLIGAALLLVILLAAYGYVTFRDMQPARQEVGIANPAATHCVNIGGTIEIRENVYGQAGFCVFEDGRVCEEWALFRDGTCVQS